MIDQRKRIFAVNLWAVDLHSDDGELLSGLLVTVLVRTWRVIQ